MKKLLYFVSEDWYFCSHRLELAKHALDKDYEVYLLCNVDKHQQIVEQAGIKLIPIDINRSGIGLLANLMLLMRVRKVLCQLKPDIVHNVAQKPVLIGTIAARLCSIPRVVNALGGLGFIFMSKTLKARVLKGVLSFLYRFLFNSSKTTLILQNRDDYAFFRDTIKIREEQLSLIRGAGINIDKFSFQPLPECHVLKVTLVARMLKDKGVGEFIGAAKLLHDKYPHVEFQLIGDTDPKNPNSFTSEELDQLTKDSGVKWLGPSSDVFSIWQQSHISVLPSYREGLPKSLLESAAVGRAIVTADVPGCREVVEDGINGFLVPRYSVDILAEKISILLDDKALRQRMGEMSRQMAETHFSSYKVNEKTVELYQL